MRVIYFWKQELTNIPTDKGVLLGIEGIDAVGKNTQSRRLSSRFERKNLSIQLFAFPDYTTPIGKEIRAFLAGNRKYPPELRHMLFAANRWEKYEQLEALLQKGKIIIVNRYTESNLAYGKANGLSLEWLANLEKGLPKTDLVLVLDAPPTLLRSRRPTQKDAYETDVRLQERVRATYRELARKFGWTIINATGNVETVHRRIVKIISRELPNIG